MYQKAKGNSEGGREIQIRWEKLIIEQAKPGYSKKLGCMKSGKKNGNGGRCGKNFSGPMRPNLILPSTKPLAMPHPKNTLP